MNVYLFIQSLSDDEKEELKSYFLKEKIAKEKEDVHKNLHRIPIEDFVNNEKLSNKIVDALLYIPEKWDGNEYVKNGYLFKYADEISKKKFLQLRHVGIKSWKIVEQILIENNITFRK